MLKTEWVSESERMIEKECDWMSVREKGVRKVIGLSKSAFIWITLLFYDYCSQTIKRMGSVFMLEYWSGPIRTVRLIRFCFCNYSFQVAAKSVVGTAFLGPSSHIHFELNRKWSMVRFPSSMLCVCVRWLFMCMNRWGKPKSCTKRVNGFC